MLDGTQLTLARQANFVDLPYLTADYLDDRNKGDAIVKTLALVQVLWLTIQLIVQKTRNLPSAQLEIVTLAFAVLAGITYALLWKKPQDAKTPVYIPAKRFPNPRELVKLAEACPRHWTGGNTVWMLNGCMHYGDSHSFLSRLSFYGGGGLGAFVFSSLHLLGILISPPIKKDCFGA